MKENKYDEAAFFEKYNGMNRSKYGLQGAGEWHEVKKLLPDFKNKTALDLGCGFGWHCKYAAKNGASSVIGVDISKKMLNRAKEINYDEAIDYRCAAMEDLQFSKNTFDIVLSSLALHYIKNYSALVKNISNWLKNNGQFIFSVEHPVFTAYGSQDWWYDVSGNKLHFPVDNYYCEGRRNAVFLGENVIKYHRTLTTYINTLLENNFSINAVVEPQPPENMLNLPDMKDELRRPMMLIISATKND